MIFVAQRGNYHSDPHLACPEYDAFLDGAALSMKFSDPATGAQGTAVVKACRDRLAATGVDLASYNSAENAADIADLRVALGIKEWNVYGVSYGTDLAQWLLRDHPAGIRSMVLDSVSPVNQNIVKEGWPAAAGMYRALFDACALQPACAAAYPNLKEEFTATVNRLNQTPIIVATRNPEGKPVQVNIDGYTLANLVVQQSYIGTSGFVKVPSLIHKLANGDGSEAAAAMFARIGPPGAPRLRLGIRGLLPGDGVMDQSDGGHIDRKGGPAGIPRRGAPARSRCSDGFSRNAPSGTSAAPHVPSAPPRSATYRRSSWAEPSTGSHPPGGRTSWQRTSGTPR